MAHVRRSKRPFASVVAGVPRVMHPLRPVTGVLRLAFQRGCQRWCQAIVVGGTVFSCSVTFPVKPSGELCKIGFIGRADAVLTATTSVRRHRKVRKQVRMTTLHDSAGVPHPLGRRQFRSALMRPAVRSQLMATDRIAGRHYYSEARTGEIEIVSRRSAILPAQQHCLRCSPSPIPSERRLQPTQPAVGEN